MMTRDEQRAVIEAMLFVSPRPVTLVQMMRRLRSIIRQRSQADQASAVDESSEVESESSVETAAPGDVDLLAVQAEESLTSDGADALEQLLEKKRELEDDVSRDEIRQVVREIQEEYSTSGHGIELVEVAKGFQFRTKYEVSQLIRDEVEEAPSRLSPSSLEVLSIVAYQQPVTRQKIDDVRGVDSGGVLKTLLEKGFLRVVGRSEEPGKPLIYGTSPKFLEVFGLQSLRDLPSLADLESLQMASRGDGPPSDEEAPTEFFSFDDGLPGETLAAGTVPDADQEILTELDDSLKSLRSLEKQIFPPAAPLAESTAEALPPAEAVNPPIE